MAVKVSRRSRIIGGVVAVWVAVGLTVAVATAVAPPPAECYSGPIVGMSVDDVPSACD